MMASEAGITDYRAALRAIPVPEKRALMQLTNYHGLINLAGHLALIAVFAAGQNILTGLMGAVMIICQGIGMCFLFCAMHEASHQTAFRTKWLNQAVMIMVGFLLFMGPRWFTYFHAHHHRFTHDPQRDPELSSPKPHNLKSYLIYLSGVMIWWGAALSLIGNAAGRVQADYIPQSGRDAIIKEARLMLFSYLIIIAALLAYAPMGLVWYWFVPLLCGQPFLRLFLLAEHAGCPHEQDMFHNSRTIYTSRFLLFLSWQMSYHTAHHSFPAVPFHKLARFHQLIAKYCKTSSQGYHAFHRQMIQDFEH